MQYLTITRRKVSSATAVPARSIITFSVAANMNPTKSIITEYNQYSAASRHKQTQQIPAMPSSHKNFNSYLRKSCFCDELAKLHDWG